MTIFKKRNIYENQKLANTARSQPLQSITLHGVDNNLNYPKIQKCVTLRGVLPGTILTLLTLN